MSTMSIVIVAGWERLPVVSVTVKVAVYWPTVSYWTLPVKGSTLQSCAARSEAPPPPKLKSKVSIESVGERLALTSHAKFVLINWTWGVIFNFATGAFT